MSRSVVPRGYALTDTARLFALTNFAACDGMIAGSDANYRYGFWRPFHAITLANTDGIPATEPDPSWTSLLPAPNHPEYHLDPFYRHGRVPARAGSAFG